ncbi:MAG: hypothetical protein Hyperionvirus8_30 [Hyperionvirus sp.]|uniref:Uncharacterized protein n=1 Tax=Hyperionvirus sp. TaxID=2487770 RepID=A0A3G5A8F1_9VIRU|nr:MAG: hypothetical protein Hyperionvirus8_30 [Hyperionvirus sp.]
MANIINNAVLSDQFNKLKYIVVGSKTKEDAICLLESFRVDMRCYNLLLSYVNGKVYSRAFNFVEMKKYIRELAGCAYRENAVEVLGQILPMTSDSAQVRALTRIAESRPVKPQYISDKRRWRNSIISKKCPHCDYKCSSSRMTIYIVCGYGENGYDWEGCGRDWCFTCNKMLCKTWEQDQLYMPTNRCHDGRCCKKHAALTGNKYPESYCRCNNVYVARDQCA